MTSTPGGSGGSSNVSGLSDVAVNNTANNDVFTYDASVSKWKNAPAQGGGSATASTVTYSPSGEDGEIAATNVQAALRELDATKLSAAHGHDAADVTSGQLSLERLPVGSMVTVDKAKTTFGSAAGSWPSSRPTARNDIVIVWKGDTDPGTMALAGDEWKVTA